MSPSPDYYSLLTRAISALENSTPEGREKFYNRMRKALVDQLHERRAADAETMREQRALAAAIHRVEDAFAAQQAPNINEELRVPPSSSKKSTDGRLRLWPIYIPALLALAYFVVGAINSDFNMTSVERLLVHFILAGASLALIWWLIGRHRWKRLPENIRRGMWRLYIAVCVPWLAWFGYAAFDAAERHRNYSRDVASAAWKALVVPVGAPVLFLVLLWIVSGFQQSDVLKEDRSANPLGAKNEPPPAP
jgi:hypothetical protein